MNTVIYLNGGYRNINSSDFVNTWKAVTSFIVHNNLRHCLVKQQNGYYKINKDSTLSFVTRNLNMITFGELYHLLKD